MDRLSLPDIDYDSDERWHREQQIVASLDPGDVLSAMDDLIASEPDPQKHPLFGLVTFLLDHSNTGGSPEALYSRYRRLALQAIERLVAERMSQEAD